MKKIVLTFGLISGAIMSVLMATSIQFHDRIGNDAGMVVGYASMVLAGLLIYFGIRTYRDNVGGGMVTFGRGCKVGALIAFIAATCYVATWQVLYRTVASNYITEYQEHALQEARDGGATEAAIEAQRVEMAEFAEMYKNPLVNIALTYLEPLPVALIMVLGSAGLLSRKKRDDDAPASA